MNNGFLCVFLYLIGGSFVGAFLTGNGMRFDGLRFFTLLGFSGGSLNERLLSVLQVCRKLLDRSSRKCPAAA